MIYCYKFNNFFDMIMCLTVILDVIYMKNRVLSYVDDTISCRRMRIFVLIFWFYNVDVVVGINLLVSVGLLSAKARL